MRDILFPCMGWVLAAGAWAMAIAAFTVAKEGRDISASCGIFGWAIFGWAVAISLCVTGFAVAMTMGW